MVMTSMLNRQTAQPRDLSARLLSRLYPESASPISQAPRPPAQSGAMAAQSPTGLPVYQPPPPQVAPAPSAGRIGAPTAAPQAAAPAPAPTSAPQPMQPSGGLSGVAQGGIQGILGGGAKPYTDPFGDLDPGNRKALDEYFNSLAGIDYKGSHESALMQRAMLAQLMRQWESEDPVDYTAAAPMADQFDRSRSQLEATLAARGLNGGVVGGAMSNSYSQEARGIGDYIRQLLSERQKQHHDDLSSFNNYTRGLNAFGLQQNIAEQNDPGFWGDLAGVLGGIGGKVVGGLIP